MGLDMYLEGDFYIQDWEHNYKDGVIPSDTPAKKCSMAINTMFPVKHVQVQLAYWRKANQIHKWFVDNVQDGVDECQRSYVGEDKLKELLSLCQEVLAAPETAPEKLPSGSGFFFGGTDYDEWYFDDLKRTVTVLQLLLSSDELKRMDVYYQSSW